MTQMGFFNVEKRYAALDAKNDPLVKINAAVPPAFAGAGSGKRSEAAWKQSGASQPTSANPMRVQTVGRHRHVQSHPSGRSLQSVG